VPPLPAGGTFPRRPGRVALARRPRFDAAFSWIGG